MKYFAFIILIFFLGTIYFSFLPMKSDAHHIAGVELPCPIAAMSNVICGENAASMAMIHISTLNSLLNIPVANAFSLVLIFMFATLIFILAFKWPEIKKSIFTLWKQSRSEYIYPSSLEKERSWISMFENSPSFA